MMILELAVPISYYESLRTDLLRLGILISERQSDQMIAGYSNYPLATHSHITVHLRQGPSTLPTYKTLNGRVLQTLQNAFAFSVSVISFFANFLIWLIVVTSPFALIGSLIYWVT